MAAFVKTGFVWHLVQALAAKPGDPIARSLLGDVFPGSIDRTIAIGPRLPWCMSNFCFPSYWQLNRFRSVLAFREKLTRSNLSVRGTVACEESIDLVAFRRTLSRGVV